MSNQKKSWLTSDTIKLAVHMLAPPTSQSWLQNSLAAVMDVRNYPWIMFFVIFFCIPLNSHVSLGADTISAGSSLSGDQTIVSAGKFFELGNSSNYYIGMWYHKDRVSEQTIVWVANRETPVSDRFSSELRISGGDLVLFNESKIPIWSTNLSSSWSSSVEAVLRDNGNLVLIDGSNSSVSPLWQSFDFPADTWLPGAKIALNKITKRNTLLISSKSKDNPSPGLFSLELDPNQSRYLIFWNRSKDYWSSGSWNGQIFTLVPEMRSNYIYNFSYVNNVNETYFTYSLYNKTLISRFVMADGGQIQQQSWSENTQQWFLFFSSNNLRLPSNPQAVEARSAQECESTCLGNCDCTAYAYNGSLCSVWFGDLLNMQQLGDDSNENTIYIRLAASEFSSSKNDKGIVIGGVVGSLVIVSLFGLAMFVFLRRKTVKMGKAFFPSSAARQINQEHGEILSLLDHRLERNADLEELTRICKVACWCIQDDEAHRPSMGLVVQILEGVVNVNPPPIPRSLQALTENQESIIFFTESSSSQSSQAQSHTSTASSQTKSPTSNTSSKS
ncbi:hypothetical protein SADUNF_Sadunf13G0115600 [Salix dunnii]|uniref:Bulb-type lectin domain-containing protein n=1 Tax=Salix dunnii TaxID=1413687 RepID=A0A835JPS8_9ROSI|nr:hypothetical protein SADUNF_Sadunf13G0115600 [Salix dunnii]